MKARTRSAWVGILSIAAVLLPAAGITYLGTVSYKEDRGIVAAKLDELFRAAEAVAQGIEGELRAGLEGAAALATSAPDRGALADLARAHPLAAAPFYIGPDGGLAWPAPDPLRAEREPPPFLASAPRTCPERGFETCIRALRAAQRRARQLDAARAAELGACARAESACEVAPAKRREARRLYTLLARYDDTGPDALLGLARLARRGGDVEAADGYYADLRDRFGGRTDDDGVSYALIADLGRAEVAAEPSARLALYEQLIERQYTAPPATLALIADRLRASLEDEELVAAARVRLGTLDTRLRDARIDARFAATLRGEIDDLWRSATDQARGRPALRSPQRTLIYRRTGSGGVVGIVVERAALQEVAAGAAEDLDRLASGTRPEVQRLGSARADSATRILATAGFGPLLPHLTLALVQDRAMPDPLDEIVRSRGRRHVVITGGLALLLIAGLIATIRGAARERELARLKSDFVSTVSHELKTPLTSIRMFGEMLQQGVAGDDRHRERRYQEIIVKESQRLGLLIANLLDYSQIEKGTRRYRPEAESAADIARDAVETFRRFGDGSDADIELDIEDAGDADVLVDREVVVQCLINLLGNAVKYGGSDQPITVRVRRTADGRVVFSVRDRGPGIPAAEQERIFKEFYRAPAAYRSGVEGTGLGLALVKRHVDAQGGGVEVDSAPGKGATFSLVFPEAAEVRA